MTQKLPTTIEDKAHELDILFCEHASISQIQNFFSVNQDNLVDIFSKMICWSNLFSPEFIAAVELPFVKQICLFLNNRLVMGYSTKMNFCAAVIMAEWIDAEKKAMFWNVLKNSTSSTNYADSSVMEEINTARKTFLYHIMRRSGRKISKAPTGSWRRSGRIPSLSSKRAGKLRDWIFP